MAKVERKKQIVKKEAKEMALVRKFFKDDKGLELVEYAVMTALIVAAIIAAVLALSGAISGRFSNVQTVIEGINT